MRGFSIAIAVLIGISFVVTAVYVESQSTTGNPVTQPRTVAGFDQIQLDAPGTVVVQQGDQPTVSITGDQAVLSDIVTTSDNGQLTISDAGGWLSALRPTSSLHYVVTAPDVKSVLVSSAGTIDATNLKANQLDVSVTGSGKVVLDKLSAQQLNVSLAGSGSIDVNGDVQSQNVNVTGAGSYLAGRLMSKNATIQASRYARATVNVSGAIQANVDTFSSVNYLGNPSIVAHTSGFATLTRLASS